MGVDRRGSRLSDQLHTAQERSHDQERAEAQLSPVAHTGQDPSLAIISREASFGEVHRAHSEEGSFATAMGVTSSIVKNGCTQCRVKNVRSRWIVRTKFNSR